MEQRTFASFLFDNPEFYDRVFPVDDDSHMLLSCELARLFKVKAVKKVLDVGCGTGRDLAHLSHYIPYCVGIDISTRLIAYAADRYKHIKFVAGDMTSFRLDDSFDLITCFGSVITYAIANEDLERTLSTFWEHANEDALLILGLRNASALLANPDALVTSSFEVRDSILEANAICNYSIDRNLQILRRTRTWKRSGHEDVTDFSEYRLLFPLEISYFLSKAGFSVVGIYDNIELFRSNLTGSHLYIAARRVGRSI